MKKILLGIILVIGFAQTFAAENVCTMDAKQCPDGSWVGRTGPNCEFVCEEEKVSEVCTTDYEPVCGQPPMPQCPEGMGCIQVMPSIKTYSNECIARQDNAEILYNGACEEEKELSEFNDITQMTQEEELEGCISWYDGCNSCSVKNGVIGGCTKMACQTKETPYCMTYELTDEMKSLLTHLNGEVMYVGGSKYFNETTGLYDYDSIIEDYKNYNKLLSVDGIDGTTKSYIRDEINHLKNLINNKEFNEQSIGMANPAAVKCENDGGTNYSIKDKDGNEMGVCHLSTGKVCGDWEYYRGECGSQFTLKDKKTINSIYKIFKNHIENLTDENLIKLMKMIIISNKLEKMIDSIDTLNNYKKVLNYIYNPFHTYLKELLKVWVNNNINDLISKEPVLGGKWYLVDISNIGNNTYSIFFEDGHIETVVDIQFIVNSGKLEYIIK